MHEHMSRGGTSLAWWQCWRIVGVALMATWWSGVAVAAGRWWLATAQSGRNTAVKIEEGLVVWWFFGVEVLLEW